MTLYEIIKTVNYYAKQQPTVNQIIESGDVYDISKEDYEMKFGAFCLSQNTPHICDGQFWSFNFYMIYVDRLTQDKSNMLEIQSAGTETIRNVVAKLNTLSMIDISDPLEIETFSQRFSEECAGAFVNVKIKTPITSVCTLVAKNLGEFAPEQFSDAFFKYVETL